LLRFEKRLAALAGVLAVGGASAAAVESKLQSSGPSVVYNEIEAALVHLADVTAQAHETLNATAQAVGAQTLNASGGVPKVSAGDMVRSVLGLG